MAKIFKKFSVREGTLDFPIKSLGLTTIAYRYVRTIQSLKDQAKAQDPPCELAYQPFQMLNCPPYQHAKDFKIFKVVADLVPLPIEPVFTYTPQPNNPLRRRE